MLEVTPQDLVSITIPIAVLFLILFAGLKRTLFLPALERLDHLEGRIKSITERAGETEVRARSTVEEVRSEWGRAREAAARTRESALREATAEAGGVVEEARRKVREIGVRGRKAADDHAARLRKDLLPQVNHWADDLVDRVLNV